MQWLEIAKNLPTGHTTRRDCPDCGEGTNTNAAIVNHTTDGYSLYCNACGYNPFVGRGKQTLAELAHIRELNEAASKLDLRALELPNDYSTTIPLAGRLWLYSGGLAEPNWTAHNIGYSESLERVILPIFDSNGKLQWFQGRAIHDGQEPKYLQPSRDKAGAILLVTPRECTSKRVVIVEDMLSAYRVGRWLPCASLLGTKISPAQANTLSTYEQATTWLDGDRAGRRGSLHVRKTLGLLMETSDIRTEKDPKAYSDKDIRRILCLQ